MQMDATLSKEPAKRIERKHYASVAERVAESTVSFRNFKFEGAKDAFPNEPALRTVDQYFPYAVGGELLVDYPVTKAHDAECGRKAEVLKKLGYRYLVVKPDMDEFAAKEELGV